MQTEHLDHALEQEFAGHGQTIHNLKVSDPAFKSLLELNHQIWREIHNIENGVTAASDDYLTALRKQRLSILDDVARHISAAEQ
ncbi:YdcH family protein [Candidatus Viadribacter manganicus]|uniref:DUF465 domain-containing protein n=1 Tax=Candidatus Viadribacter manganicus TaxID=1759059 RepID=A0A1B1AHV1_9PROT|nr:hypothetical protein [Candidatus Viadribacter manganicus]ANP46120.1 hypothetical protein ATE48_09400 [Candidatus Viadribacter manganicus]